MAIKALNEEKERLRKKRRQKRKAPYDEDTPLAHLIDGKYEEQLKDMLYEWDKLIEERIQPLKSSRFTFIHEYSRRPVYWSLARFLSPDGRQLRVSLMDFYRYLSTHTNLGGVTTIKTALCRARQEVVT